MSARSSLRLTLALLAGSALVPAFAQAAKADRGEGRAASALRERMEANAKELGLTEEQKQKLTPIIKDELSQIAALRNDTALSRKDKAQRLKAIHDGVVPQVKAILTPEQFAQWEKKQAENRERLRDRVKAKKS